MTLREKKLLALVYMDVYKAVKGRRIKVVARDGWFGVSYPDSDDKVEYAVYVQEMMIKLSLLSTQLHQGVDTITA
jgi:hypothetical protein